MNSDADSATVEDLVNLVYQTVDAAMRGNDEPSVRTCLRGLIGMPLIVMLAGMSISLPWASRLRDERSALAAAIRVADPGRADELLRGLVTHWSGDDEQ